MSEPLIAAPQDYHHQTVWITGASSGIGEALALEFSRRGAAVVLSARRQLELERVRQRCVDAGAAADKLLVLPLDMVAIDAMPAARERVLDQFGRIDVLINNAGVSQRSFCLDTDLAVYRQLFEVDVLAQIALTQQVLPLMVAQGGGHIAVTASVAGKVGVPLRTGYCAAKHAVMGFFDALRTEVARHNIKVTTIIPGFIRTSVGSNALNGSGAPMGVPDVDVDNGMDVADCAHEILRGFDTGVDEIIVGTGPEMQLLELKLADPGAAFRLLEQMAADFQ